MIKNKCINFYPIKGKLNLIPYFIYYSYSKEQTIFVIWVFDKSQVTGPINKLLIFISSFINQSDSHLESELKSIL